MIISIPIKDDFKTMGELVDYVGRMFVNEKASMPKPRVHMKWMFSLKSFNKEIVNYQATEIVRSKDETL